MNNLFKCAAITVALISGVVGTQAIAQSAPTESSVAKEGVDKAVAEIYNALANSSDPKATIAALVAAGADTETVMSVAFVIGVRAEEIKAALPNVVAERVEKAIAKAVANPAAFTTATAAGPVAGPATAAGPAPAAPAPAPVTAGTNSGTSGGGFSGGGGGGGAGAASGS